MNLEELRARLSVLNGEAQGISTLASEEKRDLTQEEAAKLDGILAQFDRTKADIDRLEKLNQQTDLLVTGQGRKTQPDQPAVVEQLGEPGDIQISRVGQGGGARRPDTVPATPIYSNAPSNWNFRSIGDFGLSVKRACLGMGWDRRLEISEKLAAASTYGSEGVGADGGFAIPPDFRQSIMVTILGENSLLSRCDQVNTIGNTFIQPIDETTPWQSSNGIQAYWDGEAAAATQSKPQLNERTVKLNKLRALIPMTEEMLEDAGVIDSYLRRKAPDKIGFKINFALIQGTGAGMPLGILNSPGLITVTKETGQQANTIVGNNLLKMYNRMYAPSRSNSVWVYNQEVEPQILKCSLPGTDNTGNAATNWGTMLFIPPGQAAGGINIATILGRPCFPTQACPALSSVGDILLIDFSQYLALLKSGPNPRVDVSMHLWFDQDLTAFKFTLRMGGVPWWSVAASPLAGSNTYSPYIALGAR